MTPSLQLPRWVRATCCQHCQPRLCRGGVGSAPRWALSREIHHGVNVCSASSPPLLRGLARCHAGSAAGSAGGQQGQLLFNIVAPPWKGRLAKMGRVRARQSLRLGRSPAALSSALNSLGLCGSTRKLFTPKPRWGFRCAAAECCSPCQLSGCLGVPSVMPRSDACRGFPQFSGIGAVGGCDMRQLLCLSWVRARSCSALVKLSTASRPPDLALSICWKHSLFCPAFVSSQLLVIFHGVFPSDSCAA